MRIDLQPAYMLHSRKVSDSRSVVDFITRDYGLVSAMARAPSKKQSPFALFKPCFISWMGNKELKTLTLYELAAVTMPVLEGKPLFCGFYLNELLVRLLNKADGSAALYDVYQSVLLRLPSASSVEPFLRQFERLLLEEAGFGVDWTRDILGRRIDSNFGYRLEPRKGFDLAYQDADTADRNTVIYSGKAINAIAVNNYTDEQTLWTAKHVMRQLLTLRLGKKPLKSRELFLP